MSKPRVLIDTNILLSGLIWNGNEARLLEMAITGDVHLLVPEFVLGEAHRVLARKFPGHEQLLDEVIALLDHEILGHPSTERVESAKQMLRDPADAEVLASIIESKPDFAVTGDKDLLTADIRRMYGTCSCREFLRRISEE
ncbi:MAG TPA: putative toxin-antitoxin system toxin component, PIN family [Armatimonadota bacterium]|nr:putative toxin-antitoxin system toxin component, PIN family [Armatimonadota bacterium]